MTKKENHKNQSKTVETLTQTKFSYSPKKKIEQESNYFIKLN